LNIKSLYQVRELVQKVVVQHSAFNIFLGILAVDALTLIRLAEDSHLEALAVLLLAVGLLATASIDVPRRDVCFLGAFPAFILL
jgi:hypothetical protein